MKQKHISNVEYPVNETNYVWCISYPVTAVILERTEICDFKQQIPCRFMKLYIPTYVGVYASLGNDDYTDKRPMSIKWLCVSQIISKTCTVYLNNLLYNDLQYTNAQELMG